ncbi:hypothetical protein GDO86_010346 [Hymenochirus boettgeri]|uniref:Centrosomal protein of 63 kDa n=1 Tax=Hymenochirus boettgeri TaxID=247094 RepID=A0A8T2JP41_9PIPI|nr:hypothetical protein GDO86_010346 [Hymenochirus boettgeri]
MHNMEALLEGIQQQDMMRGLKGSCEAELQELMRQIDIMLEHKRSEWEAETETLKTCLELKDRELNLAQTQEDQLSQEIKRLRQQLAQQETENQRKIVEYEAQLSFLKEELNKLKKCYEKVQKRHLRMEMKSRGEEERSEVSRLSRKLEDFRQRSLDWEKQRLIYQQQLSALEAQRKVLMEQAEIYKQHSQNCKEILEQTNLAGRSECQNLSGQLLRANDSLCAKEEELENLKIQLQSATEGKKQAENVLEHSKQVIQVLKEEKAELRETLHAQTEFLQGSKAQKEELHREVCRMSESLREKEENISLLEEQLKEKRLSQGCTEVDAMMSQLSVSRMNEQRLQAEVTSLENSFGSVKTQCQLLSKELREKVESLQLLENEHRKCFSEITKLKGQLSQAEFSYNSALDGMRKEISQLSKQLHQRDIRMATNEGTEWERMIQAEREAVEHRTLSNLEEENEKLQKELFQTQGKLEIILQTKESEIQMAVERKSQELLKNREQELKQTQERLSVYEEELRNLRSRQDATSNLRIDSRTSSLESMFSEVWKEQATGAPELTSNVASCKDQAEDQESSLPVPPTSPANAVASRFLQEEEQRSHELLQRLNAHIEELRQESQRTVQHFSQAR